MDIYTYLFKNSNKKTKINYQNNTLDIKLFKEEQILIYELFEQGRLTINKKDYSSTIKGFSQNYKEKEFKEFLQIINIINKYNYVNYCIIEDNLLFQQVNYITVNTLSGLTNPYLDFGYKVLQKNFPETETLDILKSNAYYYDKFFRENINIIINLHLKEFIKLLKKIYGKEFHQKDYLKDIKELEKFDYTLKNFILEKATLEKLTCFKFFYHIMGKVLEDMYLLPKKYIFFY